MKPLKLVLSAFGSYGGCECVDFEKMQQGLFLITGDTGAGKTTIFDGISYALYGQTSGRRRDGDMMRSQYAKDTDETFVEFSFQEGKDCYTVRRNPNWMRRSKRKNKEGEYALTKVSAKVELIMPDGTLFPGKMKETDQKIVEIIGMDMNQFSQVAMISQGDFMKLLLASSKERKEIFSKIFPTDIYWRIQMELKNQERHRYGQLENIRNRCRNEIENVQCITESIYADAWKEKGTFSEIDQKDVLELLELMILEAEGKEKECQEFVRQFEEILDAWRSQMEQKSQYDQLLKENEKLEKEIEILSQSVETQKIKWSDICLRYDKEWTDKQQLIVSLRQQMPEYDYLEQERNEFKRVSEELVLGKKKIEEWKNSLQQLEIRYKDVEEQQVKLKDSGIKKVESEQLFIRYTEELERVCKIQEKQSVWEKGQKELENLRVQLEQKIAEYRTASRKYDDRYGKFITSQAGLMAKNLEDGKPCPVCGSLHHPDPCDVEKTVEMVDQRMVEEARNQRELAQEAVETARENFTKISDQMIAYTHQILQEASYLMEDAQNRSLSDEFWNEIRKNVQEKQDLCKDQKIIVKKWTQNASAFEKNQLLLKRIEENMKKGQEMIQSAIQKDAFLQSEKMHHEESVKQLLEKLSYPSKKKVQEVVSKLEIDLKVLKQQMDEQQKQLENQIHNLQLKQGQMNERKDRETELRSEQKKICDRVMKKIEQASLDAETTYVQLEHKKQLYQNQEKEIYGIRQSNQNIYRHLKEMLANFKEEQHHFAKVRNLSRIANGELPGAAKIDFQTYMQRRYFKQMVQAANRRLAVMSRHQFLLECRDMNQLGKQGEVGLDLDVYSLVNDQIRDIKTLSGGESFMAALSLALGMADVIQQEAGKIHVDTLFIDEGFGSLDENSRSQAVQILGDLAGGERLVGIISHVHELKEQIEQKIQVKKTEHGSRIVTCYSE